jgi:hypothetical protein
MTSFLIALFVTSDTGQLSVFRRFWQFHFLPIRVVTGFTSDCVNRKPDNYRRFLLYTVGTYCDSN